MSRKLTTLIALALLVLLAGCQKEPGSVGVKPRTMRLDEGGGVIFVEVSATLGWTITLDFPGSSEAWASVDPSAGEGAKSDVRLRYEANPSAQDRELVLTLHGKGSEAHVTLTQVHAGGGKGEYGYGYDTAPSALDWLELPAMVAGDGRELLIHNMDGGKYRGRKQDGTRNWSCYWDYDDHMSLWVAYPHNNSLKGSGSRSDEWGVYDPCIPNNMQPNMGVTYGGGWTRGHQLPSADRLKTRAANVSTFYPTNMTPQEYNFNSGIWVDLENKVRSYAGSCDTLYVVTGALFESSTQYSGNNSGFRVKVPTHYFKALLAHTTGGTLGQDGYMAAGFLLPHDRSISGGNFLDYIRSIDQLEAQTGIDFFPNLVYKIGREKANLVEAATPDNWWR